ncbi:sphingomyelin phosphodiesterase [Sorangium sp. So ce385]|uniref:sphingomyelin phosphodiesterase n=1 Tax=Sorangium sp. So ce385 TaxID=3133308 RepID=UPI003F5C75F8
MPTLRLLTWNIWMMPWLLHDISPCNKARAAAIADELLGRDFDILCLEKAFDGAARGVLESKLQARYPYRYGPVNSSGVSVKINGGVWVLSRLPLSDHHEIQFDDVAFGAEIMSRKGAMLLKGAVDGRAFQIIATHLQGDDDPGYQPAKQQVRNKQMQQIARELIGPATSQEAPLFLCGDFSTPRRAGEASAETEVYRQMLATFAAENGPEDRITLDDDIRRNDLAIDRTGRVAELDYILVRQGKAPVTGAWERIIFRRAGWDGSEGRKDLSYRYAVGASFDFA